MGCESVLHQLSCSCLFLRLELPAENDSEVDERRGKYEIFAASRQNGPSWSDFYDLLASSSMDDT